MITAKSSKIELIRTFGGLTLKNIVADHLPSVGNLITKYGQSTVENSLAVLVADLSTSFDGDLNKEAIEEITIEITASKLLRNLSLETVYLCFNELKSADIYGKLSVNKVLKALNKQWEDYSNTVAERNYNEHLATKFNQPRETNNERLKRLSKELRKAQTFLEVQAKKIKIE